MKIIKKQCLLCRTELSEKEFQLCKSCTPLPILEGTERCKQCGNPLISEIELCLECREKESRKPYFDISYPLYRYQSEFKEIIRLYKFKKLYSLSYWLSKKVSQTLSNHFKNIPLVPVPPRKKKIWKTGWDQIAVISKILKRKYKINVLNILERKGTTAQKTLSKKERIENIRGNIKLKREKNLPKTVILFDDVFTTGATVNECSRILKEGGVKKVIVITLCIN